MLCVAATLIFIPSNSSRAQDNFNAPDAPLVWNIQQVDAPHFFTWIQQRALRVDSSGHPHIAYGGDHLYYGFHDGTSWHIEIVDAASNVGAVASLALDNAGYPHISYLDTQGSLLKYARWTGSNWEIETIDSNPYTLIECALELDANGNPHIAYAEFTYAPYFTGFMKYAHKTPTGWQVESPGSAPFGFLNSVSLALDANGFPHISYSRNGLELEYAHWDGAAWQSENVSNDAQLSSTSLALDANGNPQIAFTTTMLKSARRSGNAWTIETIDASGAVTGGASLVLDDAEHSHISYASDALKYARFDGNAWTTETVDNLTHVTNTTLALDNADLPRIGYVNATSHTLDYAMWDGAQWTTQNIDTSGAVGEYNSIALDSQSHPHISYFDNTNADLKYASWTAGAWNIETVDSGGNVGKFTSLALDNSDNPRISYCASDSHVSDCTTIKYAAWDGSAWNIQTVDDNNALGGNQTSLALDTSGNPYIAYCYHLNSTVGLCDVLKLARWDGNSWTIETVGDGGDFVSLALDNQNQPHLAYYNAANYMLTFARWDGNLWQIKAVSPFGVMTSLKLDDANVPHIGFYDYHNCTFNYATKTKKSWKIETIESGEVCVEQPIALALDARGRPHTSYVVARAKQVKYARRSAGGWLKGMIDSKAQAGNSLSLAIDSQNNKHISYHNGNDLNYAMGRLTCSGSPAKTKLLAPQNASARYRRRATLKWADEDCIIRYELVLMQGSKNGILIDEQKNLNANHYATQPLARGETYFWRVRACNQTGCGAWSKFWKFHVKE